MCKLRLGDERQKIHGYRGWRWPGYSLTLWFIGGYFAYQQSSFCQGQLADDGGPQRFCVDFSDPMSCETIGSGQRQEHVVFVGVPEESAVLPLKALAQEMIQRGYRATLALPASFEAW